MFSQKNTGVIQSLCRNSAMFLVNVGLFSCPCGTVKLQGSKKDWELWIKDWEL